MIDPFYRVVRVRDDGEEVLLDIPWRDLEDRSDERAVRKGRSSQSERAEAFEFAAEQEGHIRIYSSQDDGTLGPGDIIWDSEIY
jgi:hypothetical protein